MSFNLQFQFRGKRYDDAVRGLTVFSEAMGAAIVGLTPAVKKEMLDVLQTVAAAMRERHSTRWQANTRLPEGSASGKLARRSGKTMTAIRRSVRVRGTKFEVTGQIGGPFYLVVHEEGRTIRARKAKFLTIPLPAALTPSGKPRKKRARDWPDTFVIRSRKGNLLIVQRGKKKGELVPLYLLKKSVRIPPRLGLGATLEKAAPLFVDRLFNRLLAQVNAGAASTGGP